MSSMRVQAFGEHHGEPVPGLPGRPPAGEQVLWQGAPDWRRLAVEAFHWRKLALYFAALLGWRLVSSLADGAGPAGVLAALVGPLLLSVTALGLVGALAWMSARTTVYTLTNRRIAMRIGIVLTVTYNLPLSRIEGASIHPLPGGQGDIALVLEPATRIGWLHLWPHVRPWQLRRTQPMLRALPEVAAVGRQLMAAWQACQPAAAEAAVAAVGTTAPVPAAGLPAMPAMVTGATAAASITPADAANDPQRPAGSGAAAGSGLRPAAA